MGPGSTPTSSTDSSYDPSVWLSAMARLTGAKDAGGQPLVFSTSVALADLSAAIKNAITTTTTLPVDITLSSSTLPSGLGFSFTPPVVSAVPPGGTASFNLTLTGSGSPVNGAFDINFIDKWSGAILGTIPASISCPSRSAGGADGSYQVRYVTNLNVADAVINITNAGSLTGNDPAGRICANIYVFDPNEEPVSCCSCPITPNGLVSLSARDSLISNPVTAAAPTSVVVKILYTVAPGGNGTSGGSGTCDAAALPLSPVSGTPPAFPATAGALTLARGGIAWATTAHKDTSTVQNSYRVTETRFDNAVLSPTEYIKVVSICNFIQTYGSKFGICKGCRSGGMGANTGH